VLTSLIGGAKLEAQTPLRAMSAEQLAAFWEAVESDTSLQEKLNASTDGEIDTPIEPTAVVAIAKDAGFTITPGDLLRADAQAILELNDDELEKVAGGMGGMDVKEPEGKYHRYTNMNGRVRIIRNGISIWS
jgi:predicted ribosomally synthesized peptide with nif11-like leader